MLICPPILSALVTQTIAFRRSDQHEESKNLVFTLSPTMYDQHLKITFLVQNAWDQVCTYTCTWGAPADWRFASRADITTDCRNSLQSPTTVERWRPTIFDRGHLAFEKKVFAKNFLPDCLDLQCAGWSLLFLKCKRSTNCHPHVWQVTTTHTRSTKMIDTCSFLDWNCHRWSIKQSLLKKYTLWCT